MSSLRGNGMFDRQVPDSDCVRGVVIAILAILFFLTIAAVPSHSPWNASATPPTTPQCAVSQEAPSVWNFTISKERAPEVVWYDVSILLIDREGTVTRQSWAWHPLPLNYTGPGPYKQSIRSTGGVPMLFCNVTDITGNNYIDSGDYFVIESNSTDFDRTVIDELTLVYEPTADPMWTGGFRDGELVQPSEFSWMLIGIVGVAGIAVIVVVFLLMRNRKRP